MLTKKIESRGEQFVVEVSETTKAATVTDERGTKVNINYDSGNFNVRLQNGWGGWKPSMESSVDFAVNLCFDSRGQLEADEAFKEMVDYVKDEDKG